MIVNKKHRKKYSHTWLRTSTETKYRSKALRMLQRLKKYCPISKHRILGRKGLLKITNKVMSFWTWKVTTIVLEFAKYLTIFKLVSKVPVRIFNIWSISNSLSNTTN